MSNPSTERQEIPNITEPRKASTQVVQKSRGLVIAAVMATMSMVAIEATIVSTAMPQIVAQLGGLNLYSWVFTSFLLTQTAMTVVFGKLADLKGRKPVMLLGIAIFLVSSILAGFAWSMPSMIIFRLLQGAGAGAVQPVALTIVADLYPGHERAKVQGYLASVWAISAVIGPLIGGLIMRELTWSYVFWINVPVGIAAALGFMAFLKEDTKLKQCSIDWAGACTFTIAVASLLTVLTEIGSDKTLVVVIASAIFALSATLFVLVERKAADPMISFALWSRKAIAVANGTGVLASMALMGLTTFLPMYVQGVLHQSPIVAGLALTMMLLGWPAGATLATRLFPKHGLRRVIIAGSAVIPVGAMIFTLLTPSYSPYVAGFGSLIMGFGMGLLSVSSLILIQETVDWTQKGSVTSSALFSRNLGSMLGATIFGAMLNYGLSHVKGMAPVSSEQLRRLLEVHSNSPSNQAASVTGVLADVLQNSLHSTFVLMFAISLAIVLLALIVPDVQVGKATLVPEEIPG
ncbi:MAG: MDR family MFS transporter [Candidatus Obscuribacterales bacterium]|nr:MDR family MFS transporter [Candidatus Obscuribacterales bacterium]